MSTYKIIDYVKAGNVIAVFSHGSTEHQVVTAVLNTDGTVHIEHLKALFPMQLLTLKNS